MIEEKVGFEPQQPGSETNTLPFVPKHLPNFASDKIVGIELSVGY